MTKNHKASALASIPLAIAITAAIGLFAQGYGLADPDGLAIGAQQLEDGQRAEREHKAELERDQIRRRYRMADAAEVSQ